MIFEFERDFAGTMRCIPMVVRFNLDLCGIKLSLKQWSRIGRENRAKLAQVGCIMDRQIQAYSDMVVSLIEAVPHQDVVYLKCDMETPWEDPTRVPDQVHAFAASSGIDGIEWTAWSTLTRLQRFAIYKLTRASHDNDNFCPALKEFGLLE
ncbi:MAG: nitrate reductase associated protein [Parvibaculum sp.]